jgi:hypothetical protein
VSTEQQPRLDEAKIEILRVWGEGLCGDQRDEVRAAGRAITMLVEEIERLNVDLWNERAQIRFAEPPVPAERETSLQRALHPRFGSSSA